MFACSDNLGECSCGKVVLNCQKLPQTHWNTTRKHQWETIGGDRIMFALDFEKSLNWILKSLWTPIFHRRLTQLVLLSKMMFWHLHVFELRWHNDSCHRPCRWISVNFSFICHLLMQWNFQLVQHTVHLIFCSVCEHFVICHFLQSFILVACAKMFASEIKFLVCYWCVCNNCESLLSGHFGHWLWQLTVSLVNAMFVIGHWMKLQHCSTDFH